MEMEQHTDEMNPNADPAGYAALLKLSFPLIVSAGVWALQQFIDRMFLTWFDPLAVAAAMPAGILIYTIMGLFIGTAFYASTFVAQYHGAGRPERIGPVIWQGVWLALMAGGLILLLIPLARPIFSHAGHDPRILEMEITYFSTLTYGAFFAVAGIAMSGFFAGQGRTWPVLWVNAAVTGANVICDWVLIFGRLGLPAMGIKGAAIGTNLAAIFGFLIYAVWLSRPALDQAFHTRRGWRLEPKLFFRFLSYGLPSGVQFFLEHIGFTVFVFVVGLLGAIALAATTITINIYMLAFIPLIGLGQGVSILVGRFQGMGRSDLSEKAINSGFRLGLGYMALVGLSLLLAPGLYLWPFAANASPAEFAPIRATVVVLMRFIALYSIYDSMNIIFSAGVKGAGDTRFVMLVMVFFSLFGLALPVWLAVVIFDQGLFTAWAISTIHLAGLGIVFALRFLGRAWRSMRVIEFAPPVSAALPPEATAAGGVNI